MARSFCGAARARRCRLPDRKLAHEAGDGGCRHSPWEVPGTPGYLPQAAATSQPHPRSSKASAEISPRLKCELQAAAQHPASLPGMSPVASSAEFSNNTHWASSRWTQKRTKLCPVARAGTALAAALVLIQWLRGRRRERSHARGRQGRNCNAAARCVARALLQNAPSSPHSRSSNGFVRLLARGGVFSGMCAQSPRQKWTHLGLPGL